MFWAWGLKCRLPTLRIQIWSSKSSYGFEVFYFNEVNIRIRTRNVWKIPLERVYVIRKNRRQESSRRVWKHPKNFHHPLNPWMSGLPSIFLFFVSFRLALDNPKREARLTSFVNAIWGSQVSPLVMCSSHRAIIIFPSVIVLADALRELPESPCWYFHNFKSLHHFARAIHTVAVREKQFSKLVGKNRRSPSWSEEDPSTNHPHSNENLDCSHVITLFSA